MVKFILAIILLSSSAKMISANSFAAGSEIFKPVLEGEESKEKNEQERTKTDHSDHLFCAAIHASTNFVASFNSLPHSFQIERYSNFVGKPINPPPNPVIYSSFFL